MLYSHLTVYLQILTLSKTRQFFEKSSDEAEELSDLSCVHEGVHCQATMDNIVDVVFGIASVSDCQAMCEYHASNCSVFTWMESVDTLEKPIPHICFLYSR